MASGTNTETTAGTGTLEHFNIFCSGLGRREDEAGKEEYATTLKHRQSSDAANRHKASTKN